MTHYEAWATELVQGWQVFSTIFSFKIPLVRASLPPLAWSESIMDRWINGRDE